MNLFARIFCKLVELILHIRTLFIQGSQVLRDPTWLLVHYQSDEQRAATVRLAADLNIPSPKNLSRGQLMAAVEDHRLKQIQTHHPIHVAVIIPFRDAWSMTHSCIESLLKQNLNHVQLTLCLIDNGSRKTETAEGLSELQKGWATLTKTATSHAPVLHVIQDDRPFNFSGLNNTAVETLTRSTNSANPEYLLFLNNDTLWEDPLSLERLVFFAALSPRIGAVGCTLLYPNSKVQHLFLAPGVKLAGAHPCKGISFQASQSWYSDPRPVAAVTGALLLISTAHFQRAKGFDTALGNSCQDLDLCLKLQELELENWVYPEICVRHFETATRLKKNQAIEITYVSTKWGSKLTMNSYYSSELSRWSERPALTWGESAYPWSAVIQI